MPARKHIPLRTCVGCGAEKPKRELLRVVRAPNGEVTPDPLGKAAGRGAYVCANLECLRLAERKRAFERALQTAASPEAKNAIHAFVKARVM